MHKCPKCGYTEDMSPSWVPCRLCKFLGQSGWTNICTNPKSIKCDREVQVGCNTESGCDIGVKKDEHIVIRY